jgi:hypothetical protein
METRHDTADIVGALTSMAQQLGLYVVAEGIENEEQLALLRSLNCESAQGYLFAKPLDVTRATELLKTGLAPRPDTAGDNESSASLRPEEHMPGPAPGTRPSSTRKWLSLTAAALTVLTSAGLVARFANGRRPAVESSSRRPLQNAQRGLHVGTLPDAGIPSRTSEMVAVSAAAAPAAPRLKKNLSTESSDQHPAVLRSDAPVTPVPGPTSASTPNTARPALQELTSVNVVHLHGVGSCHGRLIVSRKGVAFVPDDKPGKDGFDLKYSEFLSTLSDRKLVIKSNSRTYRFRAAATGEDDSGSQLDDVVGRITRFR